METYDLVMLGVLIAATLFGAFKGFAWQVASLASLLVSYFVAYKYRDVISPLIGASPPWNTFTAMLAVYSTTSLVIWAGFRVVADFLDKMKLRQFDRQMGALLGFAKGVLFCVVVTFFSVTLLGEAVRRDIVHSRSGHHISKLLHDADTIMPAEIKSVLGPYLHELDHRLENGADDAGEQRDEEQDGDLPTNGLTAPLRQAFSGGAGGGFPTTTPPPADTTNGAGPNNAQNSSPQTGRGMFGGFPRTSAQPTSGAPGR